jgi:hypothetical protein
MFFKKSRKHNNQKRSYKRTKGGDASTHAMRVFGSPDQQSRVSDTNNTIKMNASYGGGLPDLSPSNFSNSNNKLLLKGGSRHRYKRNDNFRTLRSYFFNKRRSNKRRTNKK